LPIHEPHEKRERERECERVLMQQQQDVDQRVMKILDPVMMVVGEEAGLTERKLSDRIAKLESEIKKLRSIANATSLSSARLAASGLGSLATTLAISMATRSPSGIANSVWSNSSRRIAATPH